MHESSQASAVPRPAKHVAFELQISYGGGAAAYRDATLTVTGKIAAVADVASGDVGRDGSVCLLLNLMMARHCCWRSLLWTLLPPPAKKVGRLKTALHGVSSRCACSWVMPPGYLISAHWYGPV